MSADEQRFQEAQAERQRSFQLDEVIAASADRAAPVFKREGWCWRNETAPPNVAQIALAFKRLVLEFGTHTSRIESGKLVVRRDDGGFQFLLDLGKWHPTEEA